MTRPTAAKGDPLAGEPGADSHAQPLSGAADAEGGAEEGGEAGVVDGKGPEALGGGVVGVPESPAGRTGPPSFGLPASVSTTGGG